MTMADADRELDEALQEAHLPALLVALVQLTGDASWLRPEWTPSYTPLARNDPGIPQAEQDKIRALARATLKELGPDATPKLRVPDPALLRRMIDFVGGVAVPEGY